MDKAFVDGVMGFPDGKGPWYPLNRLELQTEEEDSTVWGMGNTKTVWNTQRLALV